MMNNEKAYEGSCFCGTVRFTVSGEPVEWAIAIVTPVDAGRQGLSTLSLYGNPKRCKSLRARKTSALTTRRPRSYRKWCKICGGHIFTEHPGWGLTDVYAAVIPDFPYHAPASCELSGDGAAHQGWIAEDEGPPERNGRLGCQRGGITPQIL